MPKLGANLDADLLKLLNVADPTLPQDAATKAYVDSRPKEVGGLARIQPNMGNNPAMGFERVGRTFVADAIQPRTVTLPSVAGFPIGAWFEFQQVQPQSVITINTTENNIRVGSSPTLDTIRTAGTGSRIRLMALTLGAGTTPTYWMASGDIEGWLGAQPGGTVGQLLGKDASNAVAWLDPAAFPFLLADNFMTGPSDQAGLQAAIDQASAIGTAANGVCLLYLVPGRVYTLTNNRIPRNNVIIWGYGATMTWAGTQNAQLFQAPTTGVRNFSIHGLRAVTTGTGTAQRMLELRGGSEQIRVIDCIWENGGFDASQNMVFVDDGSHDVEVRNCRALNLNIVNVQGGSSDVVIKDNYLIGERCSIAPNANAPSPITRITVENNVFRYPSTAMVNTPTAAINVQNASDVVVRNNRIECEGVTVATAGFQRAAIYFANVQRSRIAGNRIIRSANHAIRLGASTDVVIDGNDIRNPGERRAVAGTGTAYGVMLPSGAGTGNVQIARNYIIDDRTPRRMQYGIFGVGASESVVDNTVIGATDDRMEGEPGFVRWPEFSPAPWQRWTRPASQNVADSTWTTITGWNGVGNRNQGAWGGMAGGQITLNQGGLYQIALTVFWNQPGQQNRRRARLLVNGTGILEVDAGVPTAAPYTAPYNWLNNMNVGDTLGFQVWHNQGTQFPIGDNTQMFLTVALIG